MTNPLTPIFWARLLALLLALPLAAQDNPTQTITGKIVDKDSRNPLPAAIVQVYGLTPPVSTVAEYDGSFSLQNVPLGRQTIQVRYLGYEPYFTKDLIVNAGQELFLEIEMVEKARNTEDPTASAAKTATNPAEPLNNWSLLSARSFSVEETQRYPSSIADPARMALVFPGVRTNQDNESSVLIRGNPAAGLLWRVEGLDIPNTHHFIRPATTTGGISTFSATLLGTSDFVTGALAPEYGDAFAGAFDMRFRKGNLYKRSHIVRVGMIGLDFATEGPFKKGRSSYLVNYRYSTLGIANAFGLYLVRENVANTFQDLSFNLNFGGKDSRTTATVFGIAGLSKETWFVKRDTAQWVTILDYLHTLHTSNMAVLGTTLTHTINNKSYIKAVLGGNYSYVNRHSDAPDSLNSGAETRIETQDLRNGKITLNLVYNHKFSSALRIKTGVYLNGLYHRLLYGFSSGNPQQPSSLTPLTVFNTNGISFLGQAFAQMAYTPSPKWTIQGGFHTLYLALNHSYTAEPRVSARYQPTKSTSLAVSYGMNGKILPLGTYFIQSTDANGAVSYPNKGLKPVLSHQAMLSFQHIFPNQLRVRLEPYYQHLFRVPIAQDTANNFWFYNLPYGYGNLPMRSAGQGRNYGIEASVERSFANNYFFLVSGSYFYSQSRSNRPTWERTRMDSRWLASAVVGKEFVFTKNRVLQLGVSLFVNGNLRYSEAWDLSRRAAGFVTPIEQQPFPLGYGRYFRMDTRIAYRKDHKRAAYQLSLDLQNATNHKNVQEYLYDRQQQRTVPRYYAGILPVVMFQLYFR